MNVFFPAVAAAATATDDDDDDDDDAAVDDDDDYDVTAGGPFGRAQSLGLSTRMSDGGEWTIIILFDCCFRLLPWRAELIALPTRMLGPASATAPNDEAHVARASRS